MYNVTGVMLMNTVSQAKLYVVELPHCIRYSWYRTKPTIYRIQQDQDISCISWTNHESKGKWHSSLK